MGKVLGVQRWGPVFVSLAETVAFVPVTSALWCGNRRVPETCCPTSLAKLVSSRFSKVCFRKQRNRESERWPMPTISLHTHKFTCAHMYTYSINRHTSHTQIEMADSDKEGDYVTMAKPLPDVTVISRKIKPSEIFLLRWSFTMEPRLALVRENPASLTSRCLDRK